MIMAAIYEVATGEIVGRVTTPESMLPDQCQLGQEFYLNCPDPATHIINGEPVKVVTPQPTPIENIMMVRIERNARLAFCDWTQLPDVALSEDAKTAWKIYRQILRDLPNSGNSDPQWPTPPSNIR
jgi:hypothetical protein